MTQLVLPREPMFLDESIIQRPRDMLRAFTLAADLGGLEDKQAAAAAGMDPATWSRFKQGDVGMKPANLASFLDQCGNDLPLAYWAMQRGYSLVPRQTEMERRFAVEHLERERLEAENKLLRNLITGRAVA